MKYTATDINVLSFAYNGDMLNLLYEAEGTEKTLLISEEQIMSALLDIGYCSAAAPEDHDILVQVPEVGTGNPEFAWVGLEYFVKQNLDAEMAEKIVLNHLNAVTA